MHISTFYRGIQAFRGPFLLRYAPVHRSFPAFLQKLVGLGKVPAAEKTSRSGQRAGMRRGEDQMSGVGDQRGLRPGVSAPEQENNGLLPIIKQ